MRPLAALSRHSYISCAWRSNLLTPSACRICRTCWISTQRRRREIPACAGLRSGFASFTSDDRSAAALIAAGTYNRSMTLLANLVGTSQRVGAASARRAKVRELASFLEDLPPDDIETAVHYLSGEMTQGRIGIAYKALQAAAAIEAATEESL